jgi:membrane dipeptidase
MLIVDAHLDLAYNVRRGRDPRMSAKQQPMIEDEIATVGLPDLREGNVGLICATIFCNPDSPGHPGYTNADQARQQALKQLAWYRSCLDQGLIRFIQTANDIASVTGVSPVQGDVKIEKTLEFDRTAHGRDARDTNTPLNAILLLEGADALRTPEDVKEWFDAGLRIVG